MSPSCVVDYFPTCLNVQTVAEMQNQRDEAADDSPADLPCLEKLDSPTGTKLYYGSYCFQTRSGSISNWIITTMAVLIICGCVCPVCGVREPTHRLIIQSDGAGKLRLQPEPRTRDRGEQRLLLQTPEPSYRQARKNTPPQLKWPWVTSISKINWGFSLWWALLFNLFFPPVAWRAEWRRLFTGRFGTVCKRSCTAIRQTTIMLSFCSRKLRL